jgi:hypothetical protein
LDTKSNSKRCIACWESIPSQSSLCEKCGSFQRNWKNDLRYWSTIVGLVVFVCSALAYLYNAQRWESIELKRPETKKKEFEGEYMKSHEVSKELRMQLWNKARSSNDECWDIKLQLTRTEAMLEMERSAKQEFWSIPIQGILYFDSFHTNKTLEERFNLLGFVVKNTNGKC